VVIYLNVQADDPDTANWSMLSAIFSGLLSPTEGGCHETEAVFGGADPALALGGGTRRREQKKLSFVAAEVRLYLRPHFRAGTVRPTHFSFHRSESGQDKCQDCEDNFDAEGFHSSHHI
jgi:hypothetical protein